MESGVLVRVRGCVRLAPVLSSWPLSVGEEMTRPENPSGLPKGHSCDSNLRPSLVALNHDAMMSPPPPSVCVSTLACSHLPSDQGRAMLPGPHGDGDEGLSSSGTLFGLLCLFSMPMKTC